MLLIVMLLAAWAFTLLVAGVWQRSIVLFVIGAIVAAVAVAATLARGRMGSGDEGGASTD